MLGPDDVLKSALDLPEEERVRLARKILESFDDTPTPDVEQSWANEVARRLRDLSTGKASTIPAEEAFGQARARIDN